MQQLLQSSAEQKEIEELKVRLAQLTEQMQSVSEKKEEIIITDPFGSYTGLVKDPNEKPVQDADDL